MKEPLRLGSSLCMQGDMTMSLRVSYRPDDENHFDVKQLVYCLAFSHNKCDLKACLHVHRCLPSSACTTISPVTQPTAHCGMSQQSASLLHDMFTWWVDESAYCRASTLLTYRA